MSDERNLTVLDDYKYRFHTRISSDKRIVSNRLTINIPFSFQPYVQKYGTVVREGDFDLVTFGSVLKHPIEREDWDTMLAVGRNLVVCIARCHLSHNWVEPRHVPKIKEGYDKEMTEELFLTRFFPFKFSIRNFDKIGKLHMTSDNQFVLCIDDIEKSYWSIYEYLPYHFNF